MTSAQVSYGVLTQPEADAYWFGDAASPDLIVLGVDTHGCLWWSPQPEGWAAPEAVTPIDARQYGDGGYDGPTTYAVRALSFGAEQPGTCVAPDRAAAHAALARLRAVCSSRSEVLYSQSGPDGVWSMRLRAAGAPKVRWLDPTCFEFAFVMQAPDPFQFVAAEAATGLSTYLPVLLGGRTWPKTWPVAYGGGGSDYGTLQLTNNGDEDSPVTVAIKGPVTDPTVTLVGLTFTISGTVQSYETVVVDSRAGTVLLNSTPIYDRFFGDFLTLPPGTHTLAWSGPAADGRLTLPADEADALLTAYVASTRK